ncbi:MAG: O-antigen ligase family protein, partial [Acidobacteriia bacterium]|nr:O-antigen ligase family protein [Terriglobia bacterium]
FLAATGASLPFAWWFCGAEVAASSLFRWLLLGQALLIYLLIRGGAEAAESRLERRMFAVLLVAALLSAAYGIVDFAQPVPLPHPAADQFIWLRGAVLRRAQGVFYESSNFANFCGFFLAAVSAILLAREKRVWDIPSPLLLLAIAILGLAVLVAFSRSAWASVLTTVIVFVCVSRRVAARRAAVFLAALAIPILGLWLYSPELWDYLVNARVGYLAQILSDPNMASSGRVETWQRMFSILQDYPRYLAFGTGYRTLPYTRLFHDQLIPDNGYLSLLLETGVVGLGAFLAFTWAILRTFWTLHKRVGPLGFWSALLFSFWCGECVQLLAADAHTYWRNMIVFAAFMALALNRAEREQALPSNLARSFAAGNKGQATP